MSGKEGKSYQGCHDSRQQGVPRLSELRYVLVFGQEIRNLGKVDEKQILQLLTKIRYEIEKDRQASSAAKRVGLPQLQTSFRKGHMKKGAVVDFIKFSSNLGLLRRPEPFEGYVPDPTLLEIGERYHSGRVDEAKKLILDTIIRSGCYRLFDPSRFLLPIRNSSIDTVIPFKIVKEFVNGMKHKTRKYLEPIQIGKEEGTGYKNDYRLIYEVLQTNPVRLDVMLDWGSFFKMLNFFWPEFKKPKYERRNSETIFVPNKGFYLCKIVVSCAELLSLEKIIREENAVARDEIQRKLGLTSYATTCVLYSGLRLDMISMKDNNEFSTKKEIKNLGTLINEASRMGVTIVSDGGQYRGLVQTSNSLLEPAHTLLLMERDWSLSKFFQTLTSQYRGLVKGETVLYAPVFRLRESVCRVLRMHDDTFDRYLTMCIRSKDFLGRILLGIQSPEMRHKLRARGLEKAFILSGKSYYQIKVK